MLAFHKLFQHSAQNDLSSFQQWFSGTELHRVIGSESATDIQSVFQNGCACVNIRGMVVCVCARQRPQVDAKLLGVMSETTQNLHKQHTRVKLDLVSLFDGFRSSLSEVSKPSYVQ